MSYIFRGFPTKGSSCIRPNGLSSFFSLAHTGGHIREEIVRKHRTTLGASFYTLRVLDKHIPTGSSLDDSLKAGNCRNLDFLKDNLRQHDWANYVSILRCPRQIREPLLTLRAFNLEMQRVQDHVSKLDHAVMRYAWWKNAVASVLEGQPPKHPITEALNDTLVLTQLDSLRQTARWLLCIIDAHERVAERGGNFQTLMDLEKHTEATYSTLLYLSLASMGHVYLFNLTHF